MRTRARIIAQCPRASIIFEMRVLIVGCGYVGLPLGAELVRLGHEVHGLRRTARGAAELRAARISPLVADITKPDDLVKLPREFDWVVNCVATSGGTTEDYRRIYLDGARNLVDWLSSAPPQKLVYTSSTSVYGQMDGSLVVETSATEPGSETGRILLQTERVLLESGIPAIILRLAGIYGPERGYWLKQFLQGTAKIEGEGKRILNMVHRDDVIGAVIETLGKSRSREIYNLVDDEPVTQLECLRWLAATLGKPMPPFAPEDEPEVRKRGVTNKEVSNRKLKQELDYRFKYPTFREGFEVELKRLGHMR